MSIMQMLLGAVQSGYNLLRSVRFRASTSAYLNRTPASASNRNTWTWSGCVKRGTLGTNQSLFAAYVTSSVYAYFQFNSSDQLRFSSTSGVNLITSSVYRDPSGWYFIQLTYDDTQATASNRIKLYVNGVQVTAFGTATYPTLNFGDYINTTNPHNIGRFPDGSLYFDGYLAEVNFIDGQALTPASFGAFSPITGVWQPAKYQGTYGTNGFYLPFTDNSTAAALGTDFSGNSNTWTVNNISVTAGVTYDSMTDVPTLTSATAANYCTLNPLVQRWAVTGASVTNGNLSVSNSSASNTTTLGTIPASSGKWYYEATCTAKGSSTPAIGVGDERAQNSVATGRVLYVSDGTKEVGSVNSAYGASYTTNDVIGVAYDLDAGQITFYKNNVSQGAITMPSTSFIVSQVQNLSGSSFAFNFGQRPFAYTPPTGFVALNTFNLAASTIVKGNTVFDATLYTGNGSTQTVTNSGFQPDFVWVKSRNAVLNHGLFDSVRGVTKALRSNLTDAEDTSSGVTAFNSNGFSLGAAFNQSTTTFVGWQWKAGGTAVTNTAGSISAQVSANPTAGFSVATYTGTGANATVGHGLGVAPKMIIVKQRSGSFTWRVYHASLANTQVLYLSDIDAATTETTAWNSTTPTSTVFSVGTSSGTNANANTYVAYCWSEIDGFSKFGSYTGNGSTDGAFIYTGFRPEFVMFKRTSGVSNWGIVDSSRSTYNVCSNVLFPDLSDAELSSGDYANFCDLLSNGFKPRNGATNTNISGSTYIYMAFAENPFKNSLAR